MIGQAIRCVEREGWECEQHNASCRHGSTRGRSFSHRRWVARQWVLIAKKKWPKSGQVSQHNHDQVAKEPIVNKVCFCFPLSFLPFVCVVVAALAFASLDTGSSPVPPCSSTTSVLASSPPPLPSPIEELDCCQAGTTGPVVFPKIFFKETLPLTWGFVLDADELGNSGKRVLESLGGGFVLFVDDDGVGRIPKDDGAAELPDHGVLRCAWRKPDVGSDDDEEELAPLPLPPRAGKRSAAGGWNRGVCVEGNGDDEDSAAKATRFQTCCEDCEDERVADECLAFRTRPDVIPAYSDPKDDGARSGNCRRC